MNPYQAGPPVVLVTGASSGFGQACARHLATSGYRVFGTSRRADFESTPYDECAGSPAFQMIPMDVTDQDSVDTGVRFIIEQEGRIDVVINNAGFGLAGAVEDLTTDEMKAQFETNFFGVFRVCRTVLPHMRNRGTGCIVNISSIAGLIGLAFQGAYSASKFAVEGLTEALRMEVKPFGIHVVLIEPGDFRTGFTGNRTRSSGMRPESVYAEQCERALARMESDEQNGPSPEKMARLVEKIITHPDPKVRYTVGKFEQRLSAIYKRLAPSGFFERTLMKYYKL